MKIAYNLNYWGSSFFRQESFLLNGARWVCQKLTDLRVPYWNFCIQNFQTNFTIIFGLNWIHIFFNFYEDGMSTIIISISSFFALLFFAFYAYVTMWIKKLYVACAIKEDKTLFHVHLMSGARLIQWIFFFCTVVSLPMHVESFLSSSLVLAIAVGIGGLLVCLAGIVSGYLLAIDPDTLSKKEDKVVGNISFQQS